MNILLDVNFYLALSFIAFWLLFGKVIFKSIASLLDSGISKIVSHLKEVEELKNEAEKILDDEIKDYESLEKKLKENLKEVETHIKEYGENKKKSMEEQAIKVYQSMVDSLESQVIIHQKTLHTKLLSKTEVIARKSISESIDSSKTQQLIEESINNLPKFLKENNGWK